MTSNDISLEDVLNEVLASNLSNQAKIFIIQNLKHVENNVLPELPTNHNSPFAANADTLSSFLRLGKMDYSETDTKGTGNFTIEPDNS